MPEYIHVYPTILRYFVSLFWINMVEIIQELSAGRVALGNGMRFVGMAGLGQPWLGRARH